MFGQAAKSSRAIDRAKTSPDSTARHLLNVVCNSTGSTDLNDRDAERLEAAVLGAKYIENRVPKTTEIPAPLEEDGGALEDSDGSEKIGIDDARIH